ncbi:hypothetical protein D3C75_1344300 [compost metagenome]
MAVEAMPGGRVIDHRIRCEQFQNTLDVECIGCADQGISDPAQVVFVRGHRISSHAASFV